MPLEEPKEFFETVKVHFVITGEFLTVRVRDAVMNHKASIAHQIFEAMIPVPTKEQQLAVILGDGEFTGQSICDDPECHQCKGQEPLIFSEIEDKKYKRELKKHQKFIKDNFVIIDENRIFEKSKVRDFVEATTKVKQMKSYRKNNDELRESSRYSQKIMHAEDELDSATDGIYQQFGINRREEYAVGSKEWKEKLEIDSLIELIKAKAVTDKELEKLLQTAKDRGWDEARNEFRRTIPRANLVDAFIHQNQNKKKISKKGKPIRIGNYEVPEDLLSEYVNSVKHVRTTSTFAAVGRVDPIAGMNALTKREEIHREIFKHVKLPYHGDIRLSVEKFSDKEKESIEFNSALDEYLTQQGAGIDKIA